MRKISTSSNSPYSWDDDPDADDEGDSIESSLETTRVDPARFSLAHGGKDGHPYPVPLDVYDETIRVMRQAVDRGRLGREERLAVWRAASRWRRRSPRR